MQGGAIQNLQKAILLHQQGHPGEAAKLYRKLIKKDPQNSHALHFLGLIEAGAGNFQQARLLIARSVAIQPQNLQFIENYATILFQAADYEAALQACQDGLRVDRANGLLLYASANAFFKLGKMAEAVAQFDILLSRAPNHVAALNDRASALAEMQRYDEALADVEKALAIEPRYAEANCHKGNLLVLLKRFDEALAAYDSALALKPGLAEAWLGRANACYVLKRFSDAVAAYDKALAVNNGFSGAKGFRLAAKMRLCDWTNFAAERQDLVADIERGVAASAPFEFLAVSSAAEQLQCARIWAAAKVRRPAKAVEQGKPTNRDRIRIAYMSADFRQHPVASVVAGLFECHDRSRYEITALSTGPNDRSDMRKRLEAAFEHFIDVQNDADEQIANLIRKREIDILVDLSGYTEGSRPGVLELRPAPLQVNFLGYLGTLGTPSVDYIIADKIVIPEEHRSFYAEKVVWVPDSFQPTDPARPMSDRTTTRADAGLPPQGFVFCCFNTAYKITPDVFDSWTRILRQAEGSVLWLLAADAITEQNLRGEAAARGLAADRMVFAQTVALPEHLARLRLADLFLDTWPYNAGATASDTLWCGVPLLTLMGDSFVGRMAASLLQAVGLPDLIASTTDAYEQTAIALATQPERLAPIKCRLAEQRLSAPLFDTPRYARHIEAAYSAMYERWRSNLAPDHLVIRPLAP